jgi:hypothetical protein
MKIFSGKQEARLLDLLSALGFSICASIIFMEFSFFQFPRKTFLMKGNPQAYLHEVSLAHSLWKRFSSGGIQASTSTARSRLRPRKKRRKSANT